MSINQHERLEVSPLPPESNEATHALNEVLRDWEAHQTKHKSHSGHHKHHGHHHGGHHPTQHGHQGHLDIPPLQGLHI